MNLIYKIIAIATLTLAVWAIETPGVGDIQLEQASSKCCADYCGTDKQCYHACTHDPGGPCSQSNL